ncbi:MAG: 50S ribosomal protein L23 [Chlamydia sp.]
MKSPYDVIKNRYFTEKAAVLGNLKNATSNKSISKCKSPKYVFIVDPKANKQEIASALEEMYNEKSIRVVAVNTINVKEKKRNRRGRMQPGKTKGFKKAIVTLAVGHSID